MAMRFESVKPVFSEVKGMSHEKKLKSDYSLAGLVPAFVSLVVIAIAAVIFGRRGVAFSATIIFAGFTGFALAAQRRTGAYSYIASFTYLLIATLALASAPDSVFGFRDRTVFNFFKVLTLPCIGVLIYMMVTRRAKWRGRDILELAAAPVDDVTDGFTERPYPSGKADYSWGEILGFAKFCGKHMVSLPYIESERVYLVPIRMGKEYLHLWNVSRNISKDTWVCFDSDGNVTVNISKEDYYLYREDLSFDQLCDSLAGVYIEFLDLYRRDMTVRIIDRLNAVKIGIMS
jgi:hypothetical protein